MAEDDQISPEREIHVQIIEEGKFRKLRFFCHSLRFVIYLRGFFNG